MSLTAFYDPVEDKIHNCKEGSLMWWHEKGHQKQWKSGYMKTLENISNQFLLLTIIALCFAPELAKYSISIFMIVYAWAEIDATIYGLRKYLEVKR